MHRAASRALAILALMSRSAEARQEAVQILRNRDARDFAPLLIGMIRDPIKYEVKPVRGPGQTGELVINDGTTNRKRLYTPLAEPNVALRPGDRIIMGPDGLPVLSRFAGTNVVALPLNNNTISYAFGMAPPADAGTVTTALERQGLSAAQSQKIGRAAAANSQSSFQNFVNLWKAGSGVANDPNAFMTVGFDRFLQIPVGEMELDAQRSARSRGCGSPVMSTRSRLTTRRSSRRIGACAGSSPKRWGPTRGTTAPPGWRGWSTSSEWPSLHRRRPPIRQP